MKRTIIFCCLISMLLISCASAAAETDATPVRSTAVTELAATQATSAAETPVAEGDMVLELTSDAFTAGQAIPAKYSCMGENVSPSLRWSEPPAGTQSFALIMDDPDAPSGTWVHWVLFNIQADARSLPEDLPVTGKNIDPKAIFVGTNSSGNIGYDGPCPPSGTHRYFFKLYALDTLISLLPGATKDQVLREMEGHILAQGELMGSFAK